MSETTFLAFALIVPAAIQTALIMIFRPEPLFDALFVLREAQQLAATGRMPPLTYYAPGQTWYYSIFFRLFGASPLIAQLCQIPLFMGLIGAGYAVGHRLLPLRVARLAALAVAFYPSMLLYVLVTPYYFYLYTFLILLMVGRWIAVAQGEGRSIPAALVGGLFAGAGALTKAVLLLAPAQALACWLFSAGRWARKWVWTALGLFLVGMGLVIAPWACRNRQVFGNTVLVCASGPLVLYSANNPQSDGLYSPLPDEARVESPKEMLDHMAWCRRQARSFILSHPGHFFRLALRKLLHTWGTETTYVELINRRGHPLGLVDPALRFLAQTGWGLLAMLWVFAAGRALLRKQPPTLLEIAAAIFVLSKWLVYSLYEGGARHHLPAVPLLMLYVISELRPPRHSSTAL